MPPLNGIDRGLNGAALKALEESGHGRIVAIVDASYDIPRGAQVIDYLGQTSAEALAGIARLVPIDENEVTIMQSDIGASLDVAQDAEEAFYDIQESLKEDEGIDLIADLRHRLDEEELADSARGSTGPREGFYSMVNDEATLFVRTRDTLPYACVAFVMGHAQNGPSPES